MTSEYPATSLRVAQSRHQPPLQFVNLSILQVMCFFLNVKLPLPPASFAFAARDTSRHIVTFFYNCRLGPSIWVAQLQPRTRDSCLACKLFIVNLSESGVSEEQKGLFETDQGEQVLAEIEIESRQETRRGKQKYKCVLCVMCTPCCTNCITTNCIK